MKLLLKNFRSVKFYRQKKIRVFHSSKYGWEPEVGRKKFFQEIKDNLGEGNVFIAGSHLWNDFSSEIAVGCVGYTWLHLLEEGIPAYILRDFCFQLNTHTSPGDYYEDATGTLKKDRVYLGCI